MSQYFVAGAAKALLFENNTLIGVARTLTDSSISFTLSTADVRGGSGNILWGRYFHTSGMGVTLTDAMFNATYFSAALGTSVNMGGSVMYEEGVTCTTASQLTATYEPVSFDGSIIAWYTITGEDSWSIATVDGTTLTVPGAVVGTNYCIKYMMYDANVQQMTIMAQYVPKTLHVVLINDLFFGDINDVGNASKAGRLIFDIPRLQMDGSQDLSLNATGAATTSLTGSALAVTSTDSCDVEPYYGTITQQIYNEVWQSSVRAIAPVNGEMELTNGESEILDVYAIYKSSIASAKVSNDDLTFEVVEGTSATVAADGTVTASATVTGDTTVKITVTGDYPVDAAYALVTVAAES